MSLVLIGAVFAVLLLSSSTSSGRGCAQAFVPRQQQRHPFCPAGTTDFNALPLRTLAFPEFRPSSCGGPSALRSAVASTESSPGSAANDDGSEGGQEYDDVNNDDPEHPVMSGASHRQQSSTAKSNNQEEGDVHPHHHENDFNLSQYRTINDFNAHLAKLAKRCGDVVPGKKEDVIGCAALAEGMLHRLEHMVRDADANDDADGGQYEEGKGKGKGKRKELIRPDVVSYNTVVNAWSKACSTLAEGRGRGTPSSTLGTNMNEVNVYTPADAASRAETMLREMEGRYLKGQSGVAPDTTTYNAAIDAWAKSRHRDAASKAESIVDRLTHLTRGGEEGKDGVVRGSADDWANAKPDAITYNSLIEAWAHSSQPGGLKRAVSILDDLERQYNESGDERIKPTIRTVNQVINAYAKKGTEAYGGGTSSNSASSQQQAQQEKHGQSQGGNERAWAAANKSRRLLESMSKRFAETGDPDYKPDVTTYTSCCDAYSRVGDVAASEKAEALLEEMERMYNATGDVAVKPNFRTYTAVISAWAKTPDRRSPHRAEELLRHMEELHAESVARGERVRRDESVRPNARTYTTVISAWGRSRDPTKPQRALRILKKMQDLARNGDELARPNIYTYNAAIDACAKCRGTGEQQVQALKIAFAIHKAIAAAKGVDANEVTFSTLLKAAHQLMPDGDERNAVAKAVFKQACDAAVVDGQVIRQLQRATDRSLFYDLVEPVLDRNGHVQYDNIPHQWSKHVQ